MRRALQSGRRSRPQQLSSRRAFHQQRNAWQQQRALSSSATTNRSILRWAVPQHRPAAASFSAAAAPDPVVEVSDQSFADVVMKSPVPASAALAANFSPVLQELHVDGGNAFAF